MLEIQGPNTTANLPLASAGEPVPRSALPSSLHPDDSKIYMTLPDPKARTAAGRKPTANRDKSDNGRY